MQWSWPGRAEWFPNDMRLASLARLPLRPVRPLILVPQCPYAPLLIPPDCETSVQSSTVRCDSTCQLETSTHDESPHRRALPGPELAKGKSESIQQLVRTL